jgi:hypothetical protein
MSLVADVVFMSVGKMGPSCCVQPVFGNMLGLQYPAIRYVGIGAVTFITGSLHVSQPFYPAMLRVRGMRVDIYLL